MAATRPREEHKEDSTTGYSKVQTTVYRKEKTMTNRTTQAGSVRIKPPGAMVMLLAALAIFFAAMVAFASPVKAATLKVTNTNDSGDGSLRKAINTANGNGQADTINITAKGTVVLASQLPNIITDMQIVGPGANTFAVSVKGNFRAFRIYDRAKATVSGLKVTKVDAYDRGGGIYNVGVLTVKNSTITGNSYGYGGGIYNEKSEDTAQGGTLTVNNSTISGNTASGWTTSSGGGINNDGGTLTVNKSTISGNTADRGGGIASDIYLPGQKTTIINSTISGNFVRSTGGGLYNDYGLTTIKFTTIKNNTAPKGRGGGVANDNDGSEPPRTVAFSSVIAGNRGTDVDFAPVIANPSNSFTSKGYNLIGDGNATRAFKARGDQVGITKPGRIIRGKPGDDTLRGTAGSDIIYGLGGGDTIRSLGGTDVILAGPGNDAIYSGAGNDTVYGGTGADKLYGYTGVDRLFGQGGNDRLVGGDSSDRLVGGPGVDRIYGQSGNDFLNVRDKKPKDVANGGTGKDRCVADRGDRRVNCER
ncbi:MAG: hypothetical protein WA990_07210 [Rubrobacteraceae bacterium]